MKKIHLYAALTLFTCGCAAPQLYHPAENGDVAAIRALLDAGANPNEASGLWGNATPLHMAVVGSRLEAARLLIERGADVNRLAVINRARQARPLHYAACSGNVSMVQLLLENGADPEPGGGECADPSYSMLGEIRMYSPLELAEMNNHATAAALIKDAINAKAGLLAQSGTLKKISTYRALADSLLKNGSGEGKAVAVAGFSYTDGRPSGDGSVISERLTTELVKRTGLKVLERKAIEKMLEELKLQSSGAINQDSAKRVGKMLGADWVAVGTLSELQGNLIELNARLVNVESGEIISAVSGQVEKNWLTR